jgi:hypothetical protein
MTVTSPLFADQVINLSITGPLIRIEFGTAQIPDQGTGKPPALTPSQTLVMPIDGFVQSFGIFDQVMKKLIESGVVRLRNEAEAVAPKE